MRPLELQTATAFAPATVGNVGVGFDLLGFAIESVGDRITVSRHDEAGVVFIDPPGSLANWSSGGDGLPLDPQKNTATAGLLQLCRDLSLDFGFRVAIRKGIPIGSGMGGSAASAVGAIVAANALLEKPLTREQMLKYAVTGEFVASGSRHADNVAPCLFGGLTLALPGEPSQVVELPVPAGILCVLVHPEMRLDTRESRAVLKPDLTLQKFVEQSGNLAGFIAGCQQGHLDLIRRTLSDVVIEPQRAHLIPGFNEVKAAALKNGAIGCSISGAGPSVFAWVPNRGIADQVRTGMKEAFLRAGLPAVEAWVSPISQKGAYVL
jgi:homoserine kinase